MFTQTHLQTMACLTKKGHVATNKEKTTLGELLRFFGVLILASSMFEFQSRRSLWATTAPAKYIPAPVFGKTGMPCLYYALCESVEII